MQPGLVKAEGGLIVKVTSAIVVGSLSWNDEATRSPHRTEQHDEIVQESAYWQQFSQNGATAEEYAYPSPFKRSERLNSVVTDITPRSGKEPREPNRILELHGLMGAIGEQLSLAWTFEQDVQRFAMTAEGRMPEHQRMIQRALAQGSAYFLLGAIHSLGNLVLRLLLLNGDAAAAFAGKRKYAVAAGFPPMADNKEAWRTLNRGLVDDLVEAAIASGNGPMADAVAAVRKLSESQAFADLDGRRGMDYHRRRPQGVEHASPR